MGGSTSGTVRKGRGTVITACAALVVCLVLTGGVLYVAGRVSTALGEWEPPVGAPVEPSDGTIQTPPHSELDGPPEQAEVMGENEGAADERSAPEEASPRPDGAWLERVADDTGIPARALEGYAGAQLVVDRETPTCGLSWPTLAGIGFVESRHGTFAGGQIGEDGTTTVDVIGIPLDGTEGTEAIPDTDGGDYDDDTEWDRAVGPMQFIPSTWEHWAEPSEGGEPDPHNIDDASLAAARYLCADQRDLTAGEDWEAAVMDYNRSGEYVTDVLAYAHAYADAS
ncbi:lytic transglycosylase domain-containing protein [Nocardiopsis kunsanensis]|uniref:lytic transglycosylase domain-containing protein n=1 Tax=Nocardiopsis kunsanensis TaxID=141693 RepID=UPI00034D382B|nr:lytic transglycosylase domain-containing protein [Nocardiopsis kunsanensis]